MILAYAGRRPSDEAGDLPPSRVEYLTERVDRLLTGLRPTRVVGSAAAGSDIILLEAAARLHIPATLVLAGDVESFAADSVEDKPGWRARFDAMLEAPSTVVETLTTGATGGAAYRAVTRRIIERASALNDMAKIDDPESVLLGLLLSAGSRGDDDYTEDLGLGLEAAGHFVLRVNPKLGREASPVAFVAMPFGNRRDPTKRLREYDSDATWSRLLLPALFDAGYRVIRADTEGSLQLIDARVLWNLFAAELVVADIATLNANVFWELGVRHTARRRGTLVVGPTWVTPPFDIHAVPIWQYDREPDEVTDGQLVAGLRMLRSGIRAATADRSVADAPDSPVHMAVPGMTIPELRPVTQVEGWSERITIATELRDADQLLAILNEITHADLPSKRRDALYFQDAAGLIRLRRHTEAAAVLRPLAEADIDYEDERLQQMYAHALIRSTGARMEGEAQLVLAAHRLRVLDGRHPDSGETLGLLGSASKEQAYRRQAAGQDATEELRLAGESYRRGFTADPTDYYPGVNAVVLLRLLGQRAGGGGADLAAARELLPVVRFAVTRVGVVTRDVWAHATLGELALQELLLRRENSTEQRDEALTHYRQAAAFANVQQLNSMEHQLELMLLWRDPDDAISPLLKAVRRRM